MSLPQIDEHAGIVSGIAFIGFIIWKAWLRLRRDSRDDSAESRDHRAEGDVVELLREEVMRLANSVRNISEALDDERRARYAAEKLARDLKDRVEVLERRLRELGHNP